LYSDSGLPFFLQIGQNGAGLCLSLLGLSLLGLSLLGLSLLGLSLFGLSLKDRLLFEDR
jgi:hypothetical protein